MKGWDPQQYLRFRRERAQPFYDLLDLVAPGQRLRVVDLGCGTGALTRVLHERLGAARTVGIDSSPEMIQQAQAVAAVGLDFEQGDIEDVAADASADLVDLIFSNAALHWLPDHARLFENLAGRLSEAGQLAVQMPDNFGHPSHEAVRAVAGRTAFREHLATVREPGVLRAEDYAGLLYRLGFRAQTVRVAVYPHVLPSRTAAVEWARGSILTPYRSRLSDDEYERFEAEYTDELFARLAAAGHPDTDEAPLFFPYRRLLIAARR